MEIANDASDTGGGLHRLLVLTNADLESVNRLILSRAESQVELIPEIAMHLINSGGKRLRPMLTLALARLFGYRGDRHVLLAVSVEFMHTATLLHDDVVDESDLRRGKASARKLWGNQASVLVGDFLLGQAFRMMVDARSHRALEILSNASAVIAEGEVMQLGTTRNEATDERHYMAVIDAKTAELFAAACEVGPVLAGASDDHCAQARRFGCELGRVFQLVDDVLDYGGDTQALGKEIGDDFKMGKVTLPLILARQSGSDAERAFFGDVLSGGPPGADEFDRAREILARTGALRQTVERARRHGAAARQNLEAMPAGEHRDALSEALDFCLSRVH